MLLCVPDALIKMSKNVRKKLKSLTQHHPGWKKVHYTSEETIITHKLKGAYKTVI